MSHTQKPRLLLVCKNHSVGEMYLRDLLTLFDGYLDLSLFAFPDDGAPLPPENKVGEADLILITNPYSLPRVREHMKPESKILNLNFTFTKEQVDRLRTLPVGTEALVCMHFYSSAHQAANALYEAGLRNLNLYIHYPNNLNLLDKKMDIAIVSGPTDFVPPDVATVVDLGDRKVSLSTLLDIAVKGNILCEELSHRISAYCAELSLPDDYLARIYDSTAMAGLAAHETAKLASLEAALRKELERKGHIAKYTFDQILGQSEMMQECIAKAKKIAHIDKPTLIMGESGTGKELFAQSIHNESPRSKFPFVAINCAAIPATLLESELFGYEGGSFTGARKGGKTGLFQMANRGTLFLDEIGELSMNTQAKLLRVLEEREIMKIGSDEIIKVDIRILAATHRDLKSLVEQGQFRLDLYYRLNTLILRVPPLRVRPDDIPLLTQAFLRQEKLEQVTFDEEVTRFLRHYPFQGNVRELRNCVEYMAHISDGTVTVKTLPDYMQEEYYAAGQSVAAPCPDTGPLPPEDQVCLAHILRQLRVHSAGRRALHLRLEESGYPVSEYRLRAMLDYLSTNGYLLLGKGRAGATITPLGEKFLTALTEQSQP